MDNKPKILVVDDREENLLVVESILEDLPISIITASSGEIGLKVLLKEDISVILLDVRMPGMNGFETAAFVRQSPKLKISQLYFYLDRKRKNILCSWKNTLKTQIIFRNL